MILYICKTVFNLVIVTLALLLTKDIYFATWLLYKQFNHQVLALWLPMARIVIEFKLSD